MASNPPPAPLLRHLHRKCRGRSRACAPALRWPVLVAGLIGSLDTTAVPAVEPAGPVQLDARVTEPRAYGHFVGDRIERDIRISVPPGLRLDPDSLPLAGQRGAPIELRELEWQPEDGVQHRLRLRYQVFVSPPQVRTYELAPIRLRFVGEPREQELRLDAWPVTVAPLVPPQVSPRVGLGEQQPDAPPVLADTRDYRQRAGLYGLLLALGLGYLSTVYLALPVLRRRRPYGRAWALIAGLPDRVDAAGWRAAAQALHEALNESAGQVMFEPGLEAYLQRRPQYRPLRAELQAFFEASRRGFFAAETAAPSLEPLRRLARQARDIERGAP